MPKKRQALVEYEDMNGSCNAVTYAAENQVYIADHPAFINYSTSQKISRPGDSDDTRSVNNVLLLTIINPIYPITTVLSCLKSSLHAVTMSSHLELRWNALVQTSLSSDCSIFESDLILESCQKHRKGVLVFVMV